jgi:2,4-dichlorophenol 6-monooxygenase
VRRIELPVLVVGGGPVGLMAGVLLARQGLTTLVVERRAEPQRAPAAHVVNARTFEICRQAGVDMEAIAAAARDPADSGRVLWMTRLAGEELGRLPFEGQGDECLAFTPTPLRNLSQHRFEPILLEALRRSPQSEIRYGCEWERSEQDADGVTSSVRDRDTGERIEVRSRYVVAADGAGSRVRKSLGIEMEGPPRIQSFLMIHFEANLRPLVRERPGILYWLLDPEAGGTLVAHDIDREWVYMHAFDTDAESAQDYPEERCRALVERALGTDAHPFALRHVGTWVMSAQVAQHFWRGRIFLAGDAAHRFPPTGGLGLNTGIQDAHGLAWKLAAVEKGWAPASLLDSYEAERRPVARHNADQSLRNAARLFDVPRALGTLQEPTRARMLATLADPEGRARTRAAIALQAEHFDMLGLQLGYAYERGALVPDGSAAPALANPVREYAPTSRPGARLPHAWALGDGERGAISTLDWIAPEGLTLIVAEAERDAAPWLEAAAALAPLPVRVRAIGPVSEGRTQTLRQALELEPGGALLVRPDQHVAWRATRRPAEPARALAAAVASTLAGGA